MTDYGAKLMELIHSYFNNKLFIIIKAMSSCLVSCVGVRHTDLTNLGQGPFSGRLNQDIQILDLSTFRP